MEWRFLAGAFWGEYQGKCWFLTVTCATVLDNWRQKSNITYGNNTTFYIGRHFVTETCNIVCRLWVIYTFSALMVLNNSSFSDLFIVILHRIIPELGGQFWICVDILELSCENVLFILFFFLLGSNNPQNFIICESHSCVCYVIVIRDNKCIVGIL